jgi:hypothetical protein
MRGRFFVRPKDDDVTLFTASRAMMKTCPSLFLAGFAGLALATSAQAAIVSVEPTEDTFVTSGSADANAGSPDANYGAAGAMMISGSSGAKGQMQSLMKFNVASAKASFDSTFGAGHWTVNGITLRLGTSSGVQGAQPMNAIFNPINTGLFKVDWMSSDAWAEGTGTPQLPTTDGVTYNTLGSFLSGADRTVGTFTYTPAGDNTNATYTLTLDAGLTADVAAGGDVSLRGYAGDATVGYLFNTRLIGTTTLRPLLSVSAIALPEPGTAMLLAGAALLGLMHRRRDARAA